MKPLSLMEYEQFMLGIPIHRSIELDDEGVFVIYDSIEERYGKKDGKNKYQGFLAGIHRISLAPPDGDSMALILLRELLAGTPLEEPLKIAYSLKCVHERHGWATDGIQKVDFYIMDEEGIPILRIPLVLEKEGYLPVSLILMPIEEEPPIPSWMNQCSG